MCKINIIYNLETHVPELLDLGPDEAGHLQYSKVQYSTVQTHARMQYSTGEGRLPRLVVSVSRSQPMMSSIRCEARISRTDSEEYKLKLLDVLEIIWIIEWELCKYLGEPRCRSLEQ